MVKAAIGSFERGEKRRDPNYVLDESNLEILLDDLVDGQHLQTLRKDTFLRNPVETISAINRRNSQDATTYEELLDFEFRELLKGSINGAPPSGSPTAKFHMSNRFEDFGKDRKYPNWKERIRVATVDELTTITLQEGFTREIRDDPNNPTAPEKIDISVEKNNKNWYPGVEFQGEGLFIRFLDDDETGTSLPENVSWRQACQLPRFETWRKEGYDVRGNYNRYVFRDRDNPNSRRDELDPEFVWWHTFSHALIKAISDDSGYSTASIKERIYFERNENGKVRGGILLYAAQPGTEGTMGGLVALAPHFDQFIQTAIGMLETCSGDPLCSEHDFRNGSYVGASCFGCTMNSETSCDARNFFLDRNVFLERRFDR